jgi:hypothetical protein
MNVRSAVILKEHFNFETKFETVDFSQVIYSQVESARSIHSPHDAVHSKLNEPPPVVARRHCLGTFPMQGGSRTTPGCEPSTPKRLDTICVTYCTIPLHGHLIVRDGWSGASYRMVWILIHVLLLFIAHMEVECGVRCFE